MRTEKDIGSKNPETWAVSGFSYAIFQSEIQKISFPKNDLWGGLELNAWAFRGRFCDLFHRVCPFFVFLIVKCLCLGRLRIKCMRNLLFYFVLPPPTNISKGEMYHAAF